MHTIGHAGRVGIPGHEIKQRPPLAHQIIMNDARPDEVVAADHLKGTGHLGRIEIALLPHHVFGHGQLALVDEQGQFASLSEVDLAGEKTQTRETFVTVPCHGRGACREQRSAQAIANSVDLASGRNVTDHIHGRHKTETPIVIEAEVAIFSVGIEPGDHENGEALVYEMFYQ